MSIFTKKKETIIKSVETIEVEGAEVYMVSWLSRYGHYNGDVTRVAKAFLKQDDANNFVASLKEAAKLLQYTEYLDIRIEKQN